MKSGSYCGLSNSNVAMHRLFILWLETCFGVTKDRLSFRIVIHEKYRENREEVISEWCSDLGLPVLAFRGISFITSKRPPPYTERGSYKGTISLRVSRSRDLLLQILGMAEALVYKGGTHRPG